MPKKIRFRSSMILSTIIFVVVLAINFFISSKEIQNTDVRNSLLNAFELMESNDGVSAKKYLLDVIPKLKDDQLYPFFVSLMAMVTHGFIRESEDLFQQSKDFLNIEFPVMNNGEFVGKTKLPCIIIPSAYGMKVNGTKDLEAKINFLKSIMQKYSLGFNEQYCNQSALAPSESDVKIENNFLKLFPQAE